MARVEKTVFLSYRRIDRFAALLVFKDLTQHGYDVFVDYDGIGSGDFEPAIIDNIHARAHFVVLLTPTALDRCTDPGDWLRREVEEAIATKRNIVPALLGGLTARAASEKMTGSLTALRRYQALDVPDSFFDEAMERLRSRYLAIPTNAVLHPASPHARQVAVAQQQAAAAAPADAALAGTVVLTQKVTAQSAAAQVPTAAPWRRRAPWLVLLALVPLSLWVVLRGRPQIYEGAKPVGQVVAQASSPPSAPASSPGEGQNDSIGDPVAQKVRADEYFSGRNGFGKDEAEAVKWYRKSAEQGYALAQAYLGVMYEQGRGGLPKSDIEAVKWYRKAAEQGGALGQAYVGMMYAQGKGGLERSETEALKWYKKSAEQGHPVGQAYLGVMYEYGQGGLGQSYAEAAKWYRKAADQGHATGQAYLGHMYEEGWGGLAKSNAAALRWYRKAAEQGNALGYTFMALMYERGAGVPQDRSEAVRLYRLGAEEGYDVALQALRRLGER